MHRYLCKSVLHVIVKQAESPKRRSVQRLFHGAKEGIRRAEVFKVIA